MGDTQNSGSESSAVKAKKHVTRHKKTYLSGLSVATLIAGLQLAGQLAPILCTLPLIKNADTCLKLGKAAGQIADHLGALDAQPLDAASIVDGGQ